MRADGQYAVLAANDVMHFIVCIAAANHSGSSSGVCSACGSVASNCWPSGCWRIVPGLSWRFSVALHGGRQFLDLALVGVEFLEIFLVAIRLRPHPRLKLYFCGAQLGGRLPVCFGIPRLHAAGFLGDLDVFYLVLDFLDRFELIIEGGEVLLIFCRL